MIKYQIYNYSKANNIASLVFSTNSSIEDFTSPQSLDVSYSS